MGNPFLDQPTVDGLYADAGRLTQRTNALRTAKIAGADAAETICGLLDGGISADSVVADVGCGRGSTTLALAHRFRLRRLIAFDASQALLRAAAGRFAAAGVSAQTIQGDFHRLPFAVSALDAVVAAFCLYHTPSPRQVIGEIARCLRSSSLAVLVTKSADSYADLDDIVAESGLDPHAHGRPSLYSSFHSGNMQSLAATYLKVVRMVEQRHLFRFNDFTHLAAYLSTTPRYRINSDASAIAAKLRAWRPDTPVMMSSTVSYLVATTP